MRSFPSMRRALVIVLPMTFLVLAAGVVPAAAHDELVRSDPASGAVVDGALRRVTLYFEEPPVAGFLSMHVTGPDGRDIESGAPTVSGSQVWVAARAIQAGRYTVRFGIMSDDGHPVSGTFQFTYRAAAPAAAGVAAAGSSRTSTGSFNLGWIAGAAVAVAVLTAISVSLGARRSRRSAAEY